MQEISEEGIFNYRDNDGDKIDSAPSDGSLPAD